MNKPEEICGFLDVCGNFHKTELLAQQANDRHNEFKLENDLINLLLKLTPENKGRAIYIDQLAKLMVKDPNSFLTLLWKVTRLHFNKNFNK